MKSKTLQVYLGWDPREAIAFDVARESIVKRTKHPIQVIPLNLKHLDDILTRPIEHRNGQMWCPISDAPMSTEFAISRFTVPFMQDHGWALFADCDIICWSDIQELFELADDRYAVMVVKHSHTEEAAVEAARRNVPTMTHWIGGVKQELPVYEVIASLNPMKMDKQIQTYYNRKNWSSVILWNCEHPGNKRLDFTALNEWPGRDLHGFKWLEDSEIGALAQRWNWLINVTPGIPEKRGIWHWTLGGDWLPNWQGAPYDEEWIKEASLSHASCA